ncbi:CPBP family intramembrane metalloprotease [Dermabacteraceae bacterium TAE3-ERU27]|nr:CPBP family intramembrane metalloprotease [Dermabacteraceae bacterium TAE3-ERU27]
MSTPAQSRPRQSWLPWVIGYIAIMGVGMAVTFHVFAVPYATPYFAFTFLPWMVVVAGYTAFAAKKTRVRLTAEDSSAAASYAWVSPWLLLEAFDLVGVAAALYADSEALFSIAIVAILTALVGYAEETMFRGVILQGMLRNRSNPLLAALVSAILFSLLHAVNVLGGLPVAGVAVQLGHTLLFGLAMGPIALLTRNLKPLILAHALWDFILLSSLNAPVSPKLIATMQSVEGALIVVFGAIAWVVLWRKRASVTA